MVFHWSLSDSKSPQISTTLLCILVDHSNAAVWMVLVCPLISNSSRPLTKLLGAVKSALITIVITVPFMFHTFSKENHNLPGSLSFFFLVGLLWSLVFWSGLGLQFLPQNLIEFYMSHSLAQILVCAWATWFYRQISIHCLTPIQSCLV